MSHNKGLNYKSSYLEEQIELNKSRLNNIQSIPLTEGYEKVNTPEYQDALTFFEEELEANEEELDFLQEDKYLRDFFSKIVDDRDSEA
ncbi:MAG: hypothetical protein K2L17_05165 [Muribaculaceae bacterium]|nr:hypothetical protein [Muribaculaceae bacterium]